MLLSQKRNIFDLFHKSYVMCIVYAAISYYI